MVHAHKRIIDVAKWLEEIRRLSQIYRNVTVSFPGSLRHKRHGLKQWQALVLAWDRIKEVNGD